MEKLHLLQSFKPREATDARSRYGIQQVKLRQIIILPQTAGAELMRDVGSLLEEKSATLNSEKTLPAIIKHY